MDRFLVHRWTNPFQDSNCFFAKPNGEKNIILQDRLKQVIFAVGFEWRLSGQHFIDQNTKRPPVDRNIIRQLFQDLLNNKHNHAETYKHARDYTEVAR